MRGPSALSGAVTGRSFHLWHNTVPSEVPSGHKQLPKERTARIGLCSFLLQHRNLGTYLGILERHLGHATLDRPRAVLNILEIAIGGIGKQASNCCLNLGTSHLVGLGDFRGVSVGANLPQSPNSLLDAALLLAPVISCDHDFCFWAMLTG